ncbi:MAG: hypothetical protein JWQ11_4288 [Rhizobacter sp.]|nr:hypothetical protein [Rhizobacter sp.]
MKALKSELAKRVLADPKASHQLRLFVARKLSESNLVNDRRPQSVVDGPSGRDVIEIRNDKGGTLRFKPVFVPSADNH